MRLQTAMQQQEKGIGIMTRQALFFLTASAASLAVCSLVACNGASDDFSGGNRSSGSQRSINADIAATHDQGPTTDNLDRNEAADEPSVTLPYNSSTH
jgi:hypothetical protein